MARMLDKKSIFGLIALFAVYAILSYATFFGWREQYRERRLREGGVVADGRVTGSAPRRRKAPALLDYEFQHGGVTFSGGESVSTATQQGLPVGSAVRVLYLADAPDINRLEDAKSDRLQAMSFLGLCIETFFVVGVFIAFLISVLLHLVTRTPFLVERQPGPVE